MKRKYLYYGIGLIGLVLLPLFVRLFGNYWVYILLQAAFFSVLAISHNLVMGYMGYMNLAHIISFGVGAYTSGILVMKGVNFWLTVPIAGVAALAFFILVAVSSLRSLRGVYFTISTLAFVSVMQAVFVNLRSVTMGSKGLMPVPPIQMFGVVLDRSKTIVWVYMIFALAALTLFIVYGLVYSRVGRALRGVRDDEELARCTGVNLFRTKVLVVGIATFLAGVTGAFYCAFEGMFGPTNADMQQLFIATAGCAIGGLGTMLGPVIGVTIVTFLPNFLRGFGSYFYLVFGVILVVTVIFAPNGIVGSLQSYLAKRRHETQQKRELAKAMAEVKQ